MKRNLIFLLCLMLLGPICIGCSQEEKKEVANDTPLIKEEPQLTNAQLLLSKMSIEEKIGQLFIVRPDALDSSLSTTQINDDHKYGVQSLNERMINTLKEYPVGGIVMFSKNITTPDNLKEYTSSLQENSQIPLFMGIDEEGGLVARIANSKNFNVTKYKNMATIGNTKDPSKAKEVGVTIGTYLKEYGFNLDFAPDADINTNPKNPIIGTRAFGSDPHLVGSMVAATIQGFHDVSIMTSIKHFPGHGDTKTDTHAGYAATSKTWQQMKECELIPFIKGIEEGTDMVMVSHITTVNVTDDNLPASLSSQIITDKLRKEMNYQGIVITDSLSMGAITKQYDAKVASLKSFLAGADILLMPEDYKQAYDSIVEAVMSGKVTEARIDESVLKILNLKEKYNIN